MKKRCVTILSSLKSFLLLTFIGYSGLLMGQVSEEISSIENSLTSGLRIKGEPVVKSSIEDVMRKYNVPNVSIAVIKDGKVHWAKGYGIADTSGAKVDSKTLFQAASISKPVSAAGVHKLVQVGKVNLDEDVNTYLTSWTLPESKFTQEKKVTLRGLMTHSAGVTVHGFPGYKNGDPIPSDIEVLNGEGNTGKIFVDTFPGAINRYSGGGYTIMERVIEDVTGSDFAAYMNTEILEPMGMSRSTYGQPIPERHQDNMSMAFYPNGFIYNGKWHNYPEQAAAGLWTTPEDLAHFLIGIQEAYHGQNNKVLSEEMASVFLTKHELGHGHGPAVFGEGEDRMFGHNGKNAGFTCDMIASLNKGYGMVVMSGADNAKLVIDAVQRAIAEYYGWEWKAPTIIEVVDLSEKELNIYTGTYLFKPAQASYTLSAENGLLKVNGPGADGVVLHPMGDHLFIDMNDGTKIYFKVNGEGKCTSLVQGGRIELEKTE